MPVRYVPLVSTNIGAAYFQPSTRAQEVTPAHQQGQLPMARQEADDDKHTEQEAGVSQFAEQVRASLKLTEATTQVIKEGLANFEVPVTTVKGASVVQPLDAHELSKLTVKGAPSVTPF